MTIVTRGLGQPESPLVSSGLGQEDTGLRASLSVIASVTCDLLTVPKQQEGGGRKKRKKKELNPLIRVQFGTPKPVQEIEPFTLHEQPPEPEQPEIDLLPVERREIKKRVEETAKRETDKLLKKVAKEVADKRDEEEELLAVMLLSLDD